MIDSSKTTVLFTDTAEGEKIIAKGETIDLTPAGGVVYKHILTKGLEIYKEHIRSGERIFVGTIDSKDAKEFFANNKETMEVKIQFKGEEEQ